MTEFDSSAAVFKSGASQLLKIMELSKPEAGAWTNQDRSSMLHHQMAAPLDSLPKFPASKAAGAVMHQQVTFPAAAGITTFRDLFQHPQPPLVLLKLVKDEFKQKAGPSANRAPQQEVAYLVYLLSIAAARVRLDASITQLTDDALLPGVEWAAGQDWAHEEIRALFAQMRKKLRAPAE